MLLPGPELQVSFASDEFDIQQTEKRDALLVDGGSSVLFTRMSILKFVEIVFKSRT